MERARHEIRRELEQDPQASLAHAAARVLETTSVAIRLVNSTGATVLALASDERARTCHELEVMLDEGPTHDAVSAGVAVACDGPLPERWPAFGPGALALGATVVIAAPIRAGEICLGALTSYAPTGTPDPSRVPIVAAAIAEVLIADGLPSAGDEEDYGVVHQASGMVAAHLACSPETALALLKARAFASGTTLLRLSRAVVDRTVAADLVTDEVRP